MFEHITEHCRLRSMGWDILTRILESPEFHLRTKSSLLSSLMDICSHMSLTFRRRMSQKDTRRHILMSLSLSLSLKDSPSGRLGLYHTRNTSLGMMDTSIRIALYYRQHSNWLAKTNSQAGSFDCFEDLDNNQVFCNLHNTFLDLKKTRHRSDCLDTNQCKLLWCYTWKFRFCMLAHKCKSYFNPTNLKSRGMFVRILSMRSKRTNGIHWQWGSQKEFQHKFSWHLHSKYPNHKFERSIFWGGFDELSEHTIAQDRLWHISMRFGLRMWLRLLGIIWRISWWSCQRTSVLHWQRLGK